MNTTAHFIHAFVTHQPLPEPGELTAVERAVLEEVCPLLQNGLPEPTGSMPEARGWTFGVVQDADGSAA